MKRNVMFVAACIIVNLAIGQKKEADTMLFTYGTKTVGVKEFRKGLTKNDRPGVKHTAEEIDEYLNLYKKFKLKVQDAYSQGLDTTEGFNSELATYRKQIAKPYLTDRQVNDQLINEAYERMKSEVKAAHILIFTKRDSSPADTLIAYNKLMKVKAEIESGKITFEQAAVQYSEDPTAKDNQGSLGYFTAFQMIYEFENYAFNTAVNSVSKVFRTDFGYHIVKVYDKRASKGELTVKHILIQTNPNPNEEDLAEAEAKINEVYKKLQMGEKFETLVNQYSEDGNSVLKNGELPAFNMTNSRIPDNFKSAAFDLLNDGDYSRPIRTTSGFHIIKRLSLKPMASLNESKNTILNKIGRDSRQYKNTIAVYNKALNYYKFKENKKALKVIDKAIDTSIITGMYEHNVAKAKNAKLFKTPLFTLTKVKKAFTLDDFSVWVETVQRPNANSTKAAILESYLKAYKINTVMEYYENDLENINDTFLNLYKEYKEGILLFTLTDKKVWTKSVEDSVGLKSFYNTNSSKYQFKDRFEATIMRCANLSIAEAAKKDLEKGITLDSILKKQNKLNPLNIATPTTGKFEKGDNFYANYIFEDSKNSKYLVFEDPKSTGGYILIQVHQTIAAGQKTLSEARGIIISDYQAHLEKEWIDELLKKYPIQVNEGAYKNVKSSLTPLN